MVMRFLRSVLNALRRLLRIRRKRALAPRGPKPKLGARAICGDARITIQAGMSDELWDWLMDQGWREWIYRPDTRLYREIPASWVTRLIDCDPARRAELLKGALARAMRKPTVGNPETLAAYIEID